LLIITYTAFKLLIGLIASSLGTLLLYAGLTELKIPETITLLLVALLFLTSLIRYVVKKK
ncbi:MAG: hypothetical protein QXQ98_05555, partial [Zestosphaera sp.]